MNKFSRTILLLTLLLGIVVSPVSAQGGGAVYQIQSGDTLWHIAKKLQVPFESLLAVNDLDESSVIIPGTWLAVPGLEEISGQVGVIDLPYGESLQSISRRYQIPRETLIRLNRLTHPLELHAGNPTVILGQDGLSVQAGQRGTIAPGQSAIELAVKTGMNHWTLMNANSESGSWSVLPGEVLFVPGTQSDGPGGFPEGITSSSISPARFIQGHTSAVHITAPQGTELSGSLGDYPLSFFTDNGETYHALQGLHAQESTGVKELTIQGTLPDGTPFAHTQMVEIRPGNWRTEDVVGVSDDLLRSGINDEETQRLKVYTDIASPTKYWTGEFVSPVPPEFRGAYSSYFGTRRSYNGGPYNYFHTGLDFLSELGDYIHSEIYALAAGKVVLTGPLPVHGNTTLIDHGWGVYSLYAHQSYFAVEEGQQVNPGQLIGYVGSTGRSVEPHLHLEVWVGGLQVDPIDWLTKTYP